MSNWTLAEVQQLMDENGGGNAHARATWLGKLDALVLKEDDPLERKKEFVRQAYEERRYYKEGGAPPRARSPAPQAATARPGG
jgi:hypothetical protein